MENEPTLEILSSKLDAIYASTEKTRIYFKWTLIATLVAFVLPLLLALFVLPSFIASYTETLSSIVQ